ncbi:hypothetical protein HMN09_01004700 [Mycena chlorophos]|uniref:Uncharacterized protein n=1 Tax=Mycena chlorophos TaxID=658473 RepID=A0A8H6SKH3_MYCCL|nr:hypothetical protein HMN09_01004700 [Mycena chlorophos]
MDARWREKTSRRCRYWMTSTRKRCSYFFPSPLSFLRRCEVSPLRLQRLTSSGHDRTSQRLGRWRFRLGMQTASAHRHRRSHGPVLVYKVAPLCLSRNFFTMAYYALTDNKQHKDPRPLDTGTKIQPPSDASNRPIVTRSAASLPAHCECLVCTSEKNMQNRDSGNCKCHLCSKGMKVDAFSGESIPGTGTDHIGTMGPGMPPKPTKTTDTVTATPSGPKIADGDSSHAPSVGDKIIGGAERVAGSVTRNVGLKEKGAQRQEGVL